MSYFLINLKNVFIFYYNKLEEIQVSNKLYINYIEYKNGYLKKW